MYSVACAVFRTIKEAFPLDIISKSIECALMFRPGRPTINFHFRISHRAIEHDVYFALAKAEWMCSEQSELVLDRVKEIIESGANIEFYRELNATEKDLTLRQRNLE